MGCVVIEMLTGKPPWTTPMLRIEELFLKIARTKEGPPYPQKISVECIDFLNKCFIIQPEKRPSAAELLQHPFVTASEDLPKFNITDFFLQLPEKKTATQSNNQNHIFENELKKEDQFPKNELNSNLANAKNRVSNQIDSNKNLESNKLKEGFLFKELEHNI